MEPRGGAGSESGTALTWGKRFARGGRAGRGAGTGAGRHTHGVGRSSGAGGGARRHTNGASGRAGLRKARGEGSRGVVIIILFHQSRWHSCGNHRFIHQGHGSPYAHNTIPCIGAFRFRSVSHVTRSVFVASLTCFAHLVQLQLGNHMQLSDERCLCLTNERD